MLPEPLHPAVVHFPLVLAFLLPISAAGALWAIKRGVPATRAWTLPLALGAALTLSAWVAMQTGREEEDRVEDVVGRTAIHGHEESAERFTVLAGVLLVVAAAGMLRGTAGRAARLVATVGSLVVTGAAVQVGAAGGSLVYEGGAAQAYVSAASPSNVEAARRERGEHEREEGEHR
jgi:uncharacterized membrane protein